METVRRLSRVVLETAGYRVLSARDGTEALKVCEESTEPIHLLLTDMIMHTMTGTELADLARRSHPEMQVVFMSGYTDRSAEEMGLFEPGTAFIQKPFTVEELRAKVREVLDRAKRSTV